MTRDDNLRIPPCAIDAECSVLGGLMMSPESLPKISDWLTEDAFYRRDHKAIYRAITHLARKGEPIDPVTLGDWLAGHDLAEMVGGTTYILEVANNTPSAANIVAYAEIVARAARLRSLIDAGTEIASGAWQRGADPEIVAAMAQEKIATLRATKQRGGLQPTKPLMQAWYRELLARYEIGDRVTGMPTPWRELNEATHGMQDGDLILIPARPNMGKSVAGFNLAAFTALRGNRTAVFSLEMTSAQVMRRCMSSLANVPHDWLMAPRDCEDSELYWPRLTQASDALLSAPLLIDDTPALNIDEIRGRALRAHMQAPLRLMLIDHAHIVKRAGRNEVSELGEISRGGKALAKELGCPVVMLAQLNRGLEQRPNKRPVMSDLRASGELEQDADLILFMYRDDYYNPDTHLKGVVEIEIGKGRDVKTGERIHLANRYDTMRLEDWEGALPQPSGSEGSPAKSRRGLKREVPPADWRDVGGDR